MAINYKEIIESLEPEDIEKILDKLDVPWIDKGDFLLCKTACHNLNVDEASWKLYYYKNTHLFTAIARAVQCQYFNLLNIGMKYVK